MPFLDCVNKAQAQCASANVPYHLLQFESAHGDATPFTAQSRRLQ